jgi:hypothetical protein
MVESQAVTPEILNKKSVTPAKSMWKVYILTPHILRHDHKKKGNLQFGENEIKLSD